MAHRPIAAITIDLEVARKLLNKTRDDVNTLEIELRAARLAEIGLMGHKVSYEDRHLGKTKTLSFLVESMGRWSGQHVAGRVIKADGTLGVRKLDHHLHGLTDHGLFNKEPSA